MPDNEKTILLVEDNPNDEELTILAFQRNNITNPVVVARDGVEALNYLFNRNPQERKEGQSANGESAETTPMPQLVILDLKLPKVDGLEVLKEIRTHEKTRLLPVVVLTSSKEENDILTAYGLGSNAYVRKPVDFLQFNEAVKELGLFWLRLNEHPYTASKRC